MLMNQNVFDSPRPSLSFFCSQWQLLLKTAPPDGGSRVQLKHFGREFIADMLLAKVGVQQDSSKSQTALISLIFWDLSCSTVVRVTSPRPEREVR